MDFTEADRATLKDISLRVERIDERLGEDGKGLCGTVQAHAKRIRTMELILAVAAGSGGIFAIGTKVIGGG